MKKRLLLLILFLVALAPVMRVIPVFANHVGDKSFVFHWINKTTVEMRDTVQGTSTQFTTGDNNDNDVSFLGEVDFSKYEDCPDKRGIQFYIDKNIYQNIDTTKPTAIKTGNYGSKGNRTCLISEALVSQLRSGNVTIGFITNPSDGTVTNLDGFKASAKDQTGGDNAPTCESSGFTLNWILCPIFNGVANLSDWLFANLVEPLLQASPVSTDPNEPTYKIWSSFRVFGNIILIIAMLVIVFGQSIGGGLIDAYTAKKVLPRILIAAILINLSVYIVALLVDITNVVGAGLGDLMTAPLEGSGQFNFSPSGIQILGIVGTTGAGLIGTYLTGVLFVSGALGAAAGFIGLFVLLPAVMGLLGAFVTLVIRQGLILFLVLVSPVAFALYCLPGTDKYFKKWWELLVKTLLVYPIVIAIFAIADIMTVTIMKANGVDDGPLLSQTAEAFSSVLAAIVAFVLQFLPLVLIPFAFKFAGGAIGTLYSTLSGHGGRLSEAIKGNVNDPNSLRNRTRTSLRNAQIAGASDRMNKWRETSKGEGGFRRRAAHLGMRTLGMTDWERKRKDQNELFDKEISGKVAIGADTLERAFFAQQAPEDHTYTDYAGNRKELKKGRWYSPYRESDGSYKEVSAADVANSHRLYDGNESKIQTLIKYETGKVSNDQDFYGVDSEGNTIYDPMRISTDLDRSSMPLGSFMGNLPGVMTKAGLSPTSQGGASVGSFFATQQQRRELKHTRPDKKYGWKRDDYAYSQDWAENVGSYAASISKTSPIESLIDTHAKFRGRQQRVASGNAQPLYEPDGTAILNPDGSQAMETWTERDNIAMEDFRKIAAGLDTSRRAGLVGTVTEDGQPIEAGTGAPGRVNDAIQRFVRQVGGGGGGTPPPASGSGGGGIIIPPSGYTGSQG